VTTAQTEAVLLVANFAPEHMGTHFGAAAQGEAVVVERADTRQAWTGPSLVRRLSFHLLRKRPTALSAFSARVLATCRATRPKYLLATGIAPLNASCLREIRRLGVRTINYLTDDPWNASNGAGFFWDAVREYNSVYSPRHANIEDLRRHGCSDVRYLPFAYSPVVHFPEQSVTEAERQRFDCDVALVGGADADRIALTRPLLRDGLRVRLYGSGWHRDASARRYDHGIVLGRDLRLAVAGARVNLCMGRAANRDGHAMRSFELPAMRACLLTEDTAEHRTIFGADDECVAYYTGPDHLVRVARELCGDPARRERLAAACHRRVCDGSNTYKARLRTMLHGPATNP
jgi:spore maturation protein CgeB